MITCEKWIVSIRSIEEIKRKIQRIRLKNYYRLKKLEQSPRYLHYLHYL